MPKFPKKGQRISKSLDVAPMDGHETSLSPTVTFPLDQTQTHTHTPHGWIVIGLLLASCSCWDLYFGIGLLERKAV